jgi:predicted MFS family arabinose efflux permease
MVILMTHPKYLLTMEKRKESLSGHIDGGSKVTGTLSLSRLVQRIKYNPWMFAIALLLTALQVIINLFFPSALFTIIIAIIFFILFVFVLPPVKRTYPVRS